MHCKSLWIKASAKCINVNVISLTGDDPIIPSAEFRLELEEHHRKGRRLMGREFFLFCSAQP